VEEAAGFGPRRLDPTFVYERWLARTEPALSEESESKGVSAPHG